MRCSDVLPSFGPLEIVNYDEFLENSKELFERKGEPFFTEKITCYEILRKIGEGSFGYVYLIKHKFTKGLFTLKAVKSSVFMNAENYSRIEYEKDILLGLNHPFIVKLVTLTSDSNYVYFITHFYSGGDLLENLEKNGKFNEEQTRFFAAQVVLALEYLHHLDVIYRDVKPANVVLDHTGYVKIVDFGYSKVCTTRTYTICGTEGYMAPEIYNSTGHGKEVDWWALGILLFEINSGMKPSFVSNSNKQISCNIELKFEMQSDFSSDLTDLIQSFIQVDPNKRLGNLNGGISDVKSHAWFGPILWMSLLNRQLDVPYIPLQRTQSELNRTEPHDLNVTDDDESDGSEDITPDESTSNITPSDGCFEDFDCSVEHN